MSSQSRATVRVVFSFLGSLLIILALILLLPLVFVLIFRNELETTQTLTAFLIPALLSLAIGFFLRLTFGTREPNLPQAMLICSIGWLAVSAISALPLVIGIDAGYLEALVETMSGFTTTGITVFSGLDNMPRSILFWRSLTQWVGGLGILTFFLAVSSKIPNAHLLFGAESHKMSSGRPVPGMLNTVKILWGIYAGFTFLIMIGLTICGMSLFDSLCHSLTALSTGGFSPHDASIAWYNTADVNYKAIQYVLIGGMILGGTSFLIHYRILVGNIRALWDNSEMKLWMLLIAGFTIIVLFDISTAVQGTCPMNTVNESNVRASLFQTVSILTTTGFATETLTSPFFGSLSRQMFLLMMIIGGCVGSTAGGIKVQRVVFLLKLAKQQLRKLIIPGRASNPVIMDGKIAHESEINRVSALFFMWAALLVVGGAVTAAFSSLTGYESFSGMFSAMGNIGPCFISVEQMASLNPIVKIIYILGMLAGRLEIFPLILLFSPRTWKAW